MVGASLLLYGEDAAIWRAVDFEELLYFVYSQLKYLCQLRIIVKCIQYLVHRVLGNYFAYSFNHFVGKYNIR